MKTIALAAVTVCALVAAVLAGPATATDVRTHIKGTTFAAEVQGKMTGMKLKLNNHNTQSSFVEFNGFQLHFDIPRTVVDIDCGRFCPDLGDGYFYMNDVNLQRANLTFGGSDFVLTLAFESSGREVKGYHNKLGDDGMPDFQLDNLRLIFAARPKLKSGGDMTLEFLSPKMDAQIHSTGGCSLAGVDLCDKIFGSNGKIKKSVEESAVKALNGNQIQNGLAAVLKLYLQSKNINGKITNVQTQAGDVIITTQAETTTTGTPPKAVGPRSGTLIQPGTTVQPAQPGTGGQPGTAVQPGGGTLKKQ